MQCNECGAELRVVHVDESTPGEAVVSYTCANPQCTKQGQTVAQRTVKTNEVCNG